VAYAIQSNLDRDAEVTVWDQGIFEPSKYTLESIINALESSDFGVFVFTPDDVVTIRGEEQRTVRDNVLFELGIFIGSLGRNQSYIVKPSDIEDFHLPSDLLGITSLSYNSSRQDGNLQAALGSACNQLRKVIVRGIAPSPAGLEDSALHELGEADILAILQSWMGNRDSRLNTQVIRYAEVDQELKFPSGSTKQFIVKVASKWDYIVEQRGEHTILFRESPHNFTVMPTRRNWVNDYLSY
jgi:Predicted nucleotide-binding protein containing TIR-like domain